MNPLVTIAIPTFKRLSMLKEAVLSSISQSYTNIEILIGQDSTSEGLCIEIKEWVQEISKTHSKVKYFFNERNLGLAGNWNALAESASGEYIIIIGDDDRLLFDTIEKLVTAILPDNNVAFSNHYLIDENGNRLKELSLQNTKRFNRSDLLVGKVKNPAAIIWQNAIPISAALIRTKDVRKLKFKEDLNTPEIEFFLRLANEGASFVFTSDYTVEYRIHPHSATHSGLKVQYLLSYLIPMEVEKDNEIFKRRFIEELIVPSVNLLIKDGLINEGRKLYFSNYYPSNVKRSVKGIVQLICLCLPFRSGVGLLKLSLKMKT
jgi:GT2 family glycosyltransferase